MSFETTVVTAYYPIEKAKHSKEHYTAWIQNFCRIPCPMVIFTTEVYLLELYQLRKTFLDRTRVIVRPFDTFAMTCPSMMAFWQKQVPLDPEKHLHCPELYAIWAMKQECVRTIVSQNPYQSKYFIWCDIGIHRYSVLDSFYQTFPNDVGVMCPEGHMCFLEINKIPEKFMKDRDEGKPMDLVDKIPDAMIGGGCILGDAAAWMKFGDVYKDMLKDFALKGWFAGKDQDIYFAILMEKKMPIRLFHCKKFGHVAIPGIDWMSFPPMLGGTLEAEVDTRC
jgi:hypothetical protein